MSTRGPDPDTAARMRATAAALAAAGMDATVHSTRGVLDITAHWPTWPPRAAWEHTWRCTCRPAPAPAPTR